MARLAFTDHERLIASLGPAGLGMALDMRQRREAAAEEREDPPPVFLRPPHIEQLELRIRLGVAGRLPATTDPRQKALGLICSMPPRHGKSETTSRYTPAWYLGMHPRKRVILASYEAGLAAGFGRKARDLLEADGQALYGVRVKQDRHAANDWELEAGGGMNTAGVGGSITGKGADLMVIDDPIKNAEEASSEVIRSKQKDWWITTARTRIHPGGFVIVVATRWHEDDLSGFLISQALDNPESDQWHVLNLPALAEADDPLGRAPGEALWEARYSAADLGRTRTVSGPYWFGAMYQGHPTPDDGGIFKRSTFRYYDVVDTKEVQQCLDDAELEALGDEDPPTLTVPSVIALRHPDGRREVVPVNLLRVVQTVDLAAGEKETSDYTVILTAGVTDQGDLILLDVRRQRIPGPDQPQAMRKAIMELGPEVMRVERIGYQTALVTTLVRMGLPVTPIEADKDKVTRAASAAVRYKSGKVWHPRVAPWKDALELEMLAFPMGEHDDQVDVLAYAARAVMDLPGRVRKPQADQQQRGLTAGLDTRRF